MGPVELASAGVVAALAAVTRGPLGALRTLPPSSHRVLDWVVGAALALSPLVALHHLSVVGVVVEEAAAVVLWRLAFLGHRPVRASVAGSGPAWPAAGPPVAVAAGTTRGPGRPGLGGDA
ncbi:MAG: hypothetical protein ACRD0L_01645, partial [Acidimicrobiales bacterium]